MLVVKAANRPHRDATPGVGLCPIGSGFLVIAAENANLVAVGVVSEKFGCLVTHHAGSATDRLRREVNVG